MTSPYREAPQFLLCPRCQEMLDRAFRGVAVCSRCQGAWISQATLDTAFGNPRWPPGHAMWWHDALECPECVAAGGRTKLSARSSNGVMVDACATHGVWLDRGELGRLMSPDEPVDELAELRRRIAAVSDPDGLLERRQAWRAEIEARRREAEAFRAHVIVKPRDPEG